MEAILAAQQEQLLPGLSYTLPGAVSYVKERSSNTWFPEGAASYAPNQVRVLRFNLSDQQAYLDPHTVVFSFTITNTSADRALKFKTPNPLIMFSRARLHLASTLVEDITYFGRWVNLMDQLLPYYKRLARYGTSGLGIGGAEPNNPNAAAAEIAGASTRKVTVKLPLGIFEQHLFLPLKHCPITLELELNPTVGAYLDTADNASTTFTISDCRILADVLMLDGALENKLSEHLLQGRSLPISFVSWTNIMNTIAPASQNGTFSVQVGRAFSRIKTILATMSPDAGDGSEITAFMHPMGNAWDATKDTLEWHFIVGAHRYPQYDVKSVAESAYHLRKTLNMEMADEAWSIPPAEFHNTKFIMAYDAEKAAIGPGGGAEFSGLSTRGGELIRFEAKGINGDAPVKFFMFLQTSLIVNVGLAGCELYE